MTALGPGKDLKETDAWLLVLKELTILWGKQDLETVGLLNSIINCVKHPL